MPDPFSRALARDDYSKEGSQFSVTQLLSPPQRTFLAINNVKIESTYSHTMAVFGTAIHKIAEENCRPDLGEFAERRFHTEVLGIKVSGQVDFYQLGCVQDWKVTAGVQDKVKHAHYMQAQMNGHLCRLHGFEVDLIAVWYFQRDWSHGQSLKNPNYPKTAWKGFVQPYDQHAAVTSFATTVAEHLAASLGEPRECTYDEKWQHGDIYALIKVGGKKASPGGLCDSIAEAESKRKPGQIIETRKATRVYCEDYCGYKHCCPQYKRESMSFFTDDTIK